MCLSHKIGSEMLMTNRVIFYVMAFLISPMWISAHALESMEADKRMPDKKGWFVGLSLGSGLGRVYTGSTYHGNYQVGPHEAYGVYSICVGKEWSGSVWNNWIAQLVLRTDPRNDWSVDNPPSLIASGYWNPRYNGLIQPLIGISLGQAYGVGLSGYRFGNKSDLGNDWSLRYGYESNKLGGYGVTDWLGRGVFIECVYRIK
jgi:hypothetical protein